MVDFFRNILEGIGWVISVVAQTYWMITPFLGWLLWLLLMLPLPIYPPLIVWHFRGYLMERNIPNRWARRRRYALLFLAGLAAQSVILFIASLFPKGWADAWGCIFFTFVLILVGLYNIRPINRRIVEWEREHL